jgi:hypothetical protein
MKKIMLFLLLFPPLLASAQDGDVEIFEYQRLRIGVEAGVGGDMDGATVIPSSVRQNQSFYYDPSYYDGYYYGGYVYGEHSVPHYYVGVKAEYSLINSISLALGLRFLNSNSTLKSNKDYFLWKVSENDLISNYVRVNSIKQNTLFMGIPVEFTFYTYSKDIIVRHFFKAGVNFNFLLMSNTRAYFEDEAMNKYADQVIGELDKPKIFTPIFFVGTGLKIGRMNHPFGTIEMKIPFLFSETDNFSSFVKSALGFEFSTTIYIPIGKQKLTCIFD